jgi:biopolymer transport protein ExbB/TolQ
MLLLIPASIVSLGVFLRCVAMLRGSAAAKMADELRVQASELQRNSSLTSLDSLHALAFARSLSIYSVFQPLVAVYMIAPAFGFLGSLYSIREAHLRFARSNDLARLGDSLSNALVPGIWGVVVALLAAMFFVILRARLFHVESQYFIPAVSSPQQVTGPEAPPARNRAEL